MGRYWAFRSALSQRVLSYSYPIRLALSAVVSRADAYKVLCVVPDRCSFRGKTPKVIRPYYVMS